MFITTTSIVGLCIIIIKCNYTPIFEYHTIETQNIPFQMTYQLNQSIPNSNLLFKFVFQEKQINKNSIIVFLITPNLDLSLKDIRYEPENPFMFVPKSAYQDVDLSQLYFDPQSILTNSNNHLIEISDQSLGQQQRQLNIIAGDLNSTNVSFKISLNVYRNELRTKTHNSSKTCVNECQQYVVGFQPSPYRKCLNGQCECGYRYFGSYCQYQKAMLVVDANFNVLLHQWQWEYYSIDLDVVANQADLAMEIGNLHQNITIAFGYKGIYGMDIPSLLFQSFALTATSSSDSINSKQQYPLESFIQRYLNMRKNKNIINQSEIYIGFYNDQAGVLSFNLKLLNLNDGGIKTFISQYYALIIILGANLLIAILFFCFSNRNRLQTILPINQVQDQRPRVRRRKVQKGFRKDFIDQFFPPYQYHDIIASYPVLKENEECVICLEPMMLQKTETIVEPSLKSPQIQIREPVQQQEDILLQCSITPCFHMFHHDCIKKWFMVQKYCPICRETYTEIQIRKLNKWVKIEQSLTTPKVSLDRGLLNKFNNILDQQNNYIKRIKQSKIKHIDQEHSKLAESYLNGSVQGMLNQSIDHENLNSISQNMGIEQEKEEQDSKKPNLEKILEDDEFKEKQ